MPNYSFYCSACDIVTDSLFRMGEKPETLPCSECGETADSILIPPMVLRHSYLDGQKRKGFQDMKEAAKLNRLAAGTDNQAEKAAIKGEIRNKLKVDISKD